MLVKLTKEWLGNKPGKTLQLTDLFGQSLIDRGVAKAVPDEKKVLEQIKKEAIAKMQKPVKDKMVGSPALTNK